MAMSAPEYQVVVSFRVGSRHGKRIGADNIRQTLSNLLPALYAPDWKVEDVAVAVRTVGAGGEWSEMEGEWPPGGTRDGSGRPQGVGGYHDPAADHPGHVHVRYADGVNADHPTNI